jgi:hypothetical protein
LALLLLWGCEKPKPIVILGPLVDTPQGSARAPVKPAPKPKPITPVSDTTVKDLHEINENIRNLRTITPPEPPSAPVLDPNEPH